VTTYGSHGTLIQKGNGGTPEVFATIGTIGNIEGPGFTRELHDASVQTSDWAVVIPGMKRGEQLTVDINFDPADPTHDHLTGLLADYNSGIKRNFRIVFPDIGSTTWQFAGYVTNMPPSAPVDGVLTASVTIAITGDPAPQFGV
jgi:hypothetical protein